MNRKKILTIVILLIICIAGFIGACIYNKSKEEDNGARKSDISLSENELETGADTEVDEESTSEQVTETNTEVGEVNFHYDPNEDDDTYYNNGYGDNVLIEGSGTVVQIESDDDLVQTSAGVASSAENQKIWAKAAQEEDYMYAIKGFDFSRGFSVFQSNKYDIYVALITETTAQMHAPNATTVNVTELDYRNGDATYWREEKLGQECFAEYAKIAPACKIPYGTEYILGTGLKDFENTEFVNYFREDPTVNISDNQLIVDEEVNTRFGEGYYFEVFNDTTGMYYGTMIIQHGSRVFCLRGYSSYKDSIKDIITATADRCIYVY